VAKTACPSTPVNLTFAIRGPSFHQEVPGEQNTWFLDRFVSSSLPSFARLFTTQPASEECDFCLVALLGRVDATGVGLWLGVGIPEVDESAVVSRRRAEFCARRRSIDSRAEPPVLPCESYASLRRRRHGRPEPHEPLVGKSPGAKSEDLAREYCLPRPSYVSPFDVFEHPGGSVAPIRQVSLPRRRFELCRVRTKRCRPISG
jgi:hypothetical protein